MTFENFDPETSQKYIMAVFAEACDFLETTGGSDTTVSESRNNDNEILIPVHANADGTSPSAQVTWDDGTTTSVSASTTSFTSMVSELASANAGAVPTKVEATSDSDGSTAEVRAVLIEFETDEEGTRYSV